MSDRTEKDNGPRIRPRRDSDIRETASVLVAVHANDGYPVEGVERPVEWLTPHGLTEAWVAIRDGRIVGHVAISEPQGEGAVGLWLRDHQEDESRVRVLARLFVAPGSRGGAIGQRLTTAASEYADARHLRLLLDVMAKDTAAQRLYERLGWQRFGTTTHEYGKGEQTEAVCYVAPGESDRRQSHP